MNNINVGDLLISDGIVSSVLYGRRQYGLDSIIERKVFRVKDINLTYRQINTLDNDDLLPKSRSNDSKWRSFSIKDMIYLDLISELKKYGLSHIQIKYVWKKFYEPGDEGKYNRWLSNVAIIAAMMGENINIIITHDGAITFADNDGLLLYEMGRDSPISSVRFSITKRINKVLALAGKRSVVINHDYITWKEHQILEIINNDEYERISITKKTGGVIDVRATQYARDHPIFNEIKQSLEDRLYADAEVKKRDGRIVSARIIDNIRIN